MPCPWKKPRAGSALARFISTLRSDRRPVQTGFPTSLADLYVKNQSRLKKPSSKTRRKRHGAGTNSEPVSSVGSCTDSPDLATSTRLSVGRNREGILGDGEILGDEEILGDDICERKGSLGVGFLMFVKVFVLLLLAICGKNLVLGITAFAIFVRFCDLRRVDKVCFFKPCAEARRNLNLELVSPIREIEIQTESESNSTRSEIEDDSTRLRVSGEIMIESSGSDLSEVTLTASNSKKKSIIKKLFINRRKRLCKEERAESLDSLDRYQEIESISESNSEKVEDEIGNLIIEENQVEVLKPEISKNSEIKEGVHWLLIFLTVIMFGLMEGKPLAIILTIFCFISLYLVQVARSKKGRQRIDLS